MRIARVRRRHSHLTAVLCAVAVVVAATGAQASQQAADERPTDVVPASAAATRVDAGSGNTAAAQPAATGVARQVAAAPKPTPAPAASIPPTVDVLHADLVIHPKTTDPTALARALQVDGVAHVAGVASFDSLLVTAPGQGHPVKVLSVDPTTFRSLTPEVTANAPGVWQRMSEGDIVVRHDVAHELSLQLGGNYELHGPKHPTSVRIGAFASNGAPPLADVIVPWGVGTALGVSDVNELIVSLEDHTDVKNAAGRILDAIGGGTYDVREEPVTQQASHLTGTGNVTGAIDSFHYTDLGDGMIQIDSSWVRRYITTVDIPRLGRTRMNRVMAPQFLAAIHELDARGLLGELDPGQFAGCWVPRHIDWNPSRALSMHAWGLACDVNAQNNPLGARPRMDPRIVRVFQKWGFAWGGNWSRPDGMHFELDRIIQVK